MVDKVGRLVQVQSLRAGVAEEESRNQQPEGLLVHGLSQRHRVRMAAVFAYRRLTE